MWSFLVKIWVFDPLWWSYRDILPIVLGFILKKRDNNIYFRCHNAASLHHLMVKTWMLLAKHQYFWFIFDQNRQIWPPVVLIYGNFSYCLVTYFEERLLCFISKVFLWLFCPTKWFKLKSKQQNANIWGHSQSKYWYLTPCGGHNERYSLLFGDSFWRNCIIICFKCHNVAALHHLMVKTWMLLAKRQYLGHFLSYRDTSYFLVTYFEETLSCFISKVFCGCFVYLNGSIKLRNDQQNAIIWGHFWSKYGYLTPCSGHTERYSLLFGDSFWRSYIIFCFRCHNVAALLH